MLRYTFDIPNTPQAKELLFYIKQSGLFYEVSKSGSAEGMAEVEELIENEYPKEFDLIKKYNPNNVEVSPAYKEFLDVTSELQKSEWIDGKLVLHSPVIDLHTSINLKLTGLLNSHITRNNLGHLVFEKALINLEFAVQNYEPDTAFFLPEKAIRINDETLMYEAPDFVVEITSKSTAHKDRGVKFLNYEKHGVMEYWIITPSKKTVEQYYLIDNKYELIKKFGIRDTISSKVIKNFTIPVKALYNSKIYEIELDRFLNTKYGKIIKQKDEAIKQKDEAMKQKDEAMRQQGEAMKQKDEKISQLLQKITELK